MPTREIATLSGDALDLLLTLHYPGVDLSVSMPAVLAANRGLAAYGLILPEGVRITLPEIAPASGGARLWS